MWGARRTQKTSVSSPPLTNMTAAADRGLAMEFSIWCQAPNLPGMEAGMMFKRLILILLVALPVRAEVVRVEVKSRADVLAGKTDRKSVV